MEVVGFFSDNIKQTVYPRANLMDTVSVMLKFIRKAHTDVRCQALAVAITKDCPGRDFDCMAEALYEWIVRHIKYHRERHELVKDWENTLRMRAGDCDDFTVFGASLLGSLGVKTRIAIVAIDTGQMDPQFNHVYFEYYSPAKKRWIAFDSIVPEYVGWESDRIVKKQVFSV